MPRKSISYVKHEYIVTESQNIANYVQFGIYVC